MHTSLVVVMGVQDTHIVGIYCRLVVEKGTAQQRAGLTLC